MTQSKGIKVQKPGSGQVVVSKANAGRSNNRTTSHSHHFKGGVVGNVHFESGFYADPFWLWTLIATVDLNDNGRPIEDSTPTYEAPTAHSTGSNDYTSSGYESPTAQSTGYTQSSNDSGYSGSSSSDTGSSYGGGSYSGSSE